MVKVKWSIKEYSKEGLLETRCGKKQGNEFGRGVAEIIYFTLIFIWLISKNKGEDE